MGNVKTGPPPGTRVCSDVRTGTVLAPTDPRVINALQDADSGSWLPGDVPVIWDRQPGEVCFVSPAVLDVAT
jgi:hypothetical protein